MKNDVNIDYILDRLEKLLAILVYYVKSGNYIQRRDAAIALSKFKSEHISEFIIKIYETDNIQDFLAIAISNLDNPRTINILMQALNDPNQEVRFNAAKALGMLKNEEALNILLEYLTEYANILSSNTTDKTGKIFYEEEAIIAALLAISEIKSHVAAPVLKKIFSLEKSPRIKASIITALGSIASDKLMPIFQIALKDDDPRVRANAIEAIEAIKSNSIVGIIQPYLDDPNNRVRANVAKAIYKYGDYDVTQALTQMLQHPDKWFRCSAAYAIGEIKNSSLIPLLAKVLKDEDPDVRRNAATALRKIKSKNALQYIIPLLDDPNYDVRVQAIMAIIQCSPSSAKEHLLKKLTSETNPVVLATLISSLSDCADNNDLDLITSFLNHSDSRVVANTIETIHKILKGKTIPNTITKKLQELLYHEDNRVKSNSIKTLWNWKQYFVLDNLIEMLTSDDKKHFSSAIFVVGEIGNEIVNNKDLSSKINEIIYNVIYNKVELSDLFKKKDTRVDDSHIQTSSLSNKTLNYTKFEIPLKKDESKKLQSIEGSKSKNLPTNNIETFEEQINLSLNYINLKQYDSAMAILNNLYTLYPNNIKILVNLANLHFIQKNYTESLNLYEKIVELCPNSAKAHYNVGAICYILKNYDKAHHHLCTALKIYPKILNAYLLLLNIYQYQNDDNKSIEILQKAIDLAPRNPIFYKKLGILYYKNKNYEKTVDILIKALGFASTDPEMTLILAYAYANLEKYVDAYKYLDQTLNLCLNATNQELALNSILQSYLQLKSLI